MKNMRWLAVLGGCLILFGCDRIPFSNKETKDMETIDTTSPAGRFLIQTIDFKGKWTVLLDTHNGQTWMLGLDNTGFFLWTEIGKEPYANVDKIVTKDPKTGKLDIKPAGKKFRIDTKGNIYEIGTNNDPLGIRGGEITPEMAREELRRRGALPPKK